MRLHHTPGAGFVIGHYERGESWSSAEFNRHDMRMALMKNKKGQWYQIWPKYDERPRDENGQLLRSQTVRHKQAHSKRTEELAPRADRKKRINEHEQLRPGYRWVTLGNGRRVQIRVVKGAHA